MAVSCRVALARAICVCACILLTGTSKHANASLESSTLHSAAAIYPDPLAVATAGEPYVFRPDSMSCAAEGRFLIENSPPWAWFDPSTGGLEGTPSGADVGTFADIRIFLTNGAELVLLKAFGIEVRSVGGSRSVAVTWSPPTVNADGSALTDLAGYRIYRGTSPSDLRVVTRLDNPGLVRHVFEDLASGRHYFAVTAINADGIESDLSEIRSAVM
jgi:hypothetical protein